MGTDVVRHDAGTVARVGEWTTEQVAILKDQICPGASDGELALFQEVCKRHGLDPFTRQIHAVMRKSKDGDRWVEKLTIQVGIDGLRVQAQRSGLYRGQTPPQWTDGSDCPACQGLCSLDRNGETIICPTCDGTGVRWRGVWVADEQPAAARVGVYIDGQPRPVWGVSAFKRFAQRTRDGGLNSMWKTMGPEMIAKCAEAQALRKACPNDCSGLYLREELDAENTDTGDRPAGPPTGRRKITGKSLPLAEPMPVTEKEAEPAVDPDEEPTAAGLAEQCVADVAADVERKSRRAHSLAAERWGDAGHLALRIHVAQATRNAVKRWSEAPAEVQGRVLAELDGEPDLKCKACQCADLVTECVKYPGGLEAAEAAVEVSIGGQSLFQQLYALSQELAALAPPEGEGHEGEH